MSTRADTAARVRMSDQGLNGTEIAKRLRIAKSYAYELLSDPDGAASRARKAGYRGSCIDCGGPRQRRIPLTVNGSRAIRELERSNRRLRIRTSRPGSEETVLVPRRRKKRCRHTGKIRWLDKLEAQIALANTPRRGRDGVREYCCLHCGDWHLTKTPKRGRMVA